MKKIMNIVKKLFKPEKSVQPTVFDHWFRARGDLTLRLNYESLNNQSIIFDLGGYEGQWASDIFSCSGGAKVFVFEPVLKQYFVIKKRFTRNENIKIYPFGLGSKDILEEICLNDNCSSLYNKKPGLETEKIEIREFNQFIKENNITSIDLLKINIEGGEFELLDYLISSDTILKIKHLQVQFHDFIPDAVIKRKNIRERLSKSHKESWCYDFVWESWELK